MDFLHTYLICGLIIGRSLAVAEFQTTQEFMFSMEILSKSEKLSEIKPPLATPKPKKCLATFRRGAREGGSDRLLPCSESVLPFRGPRSCFADNCTFGDFGCLRHTHQGGILDRRDPGPNEGV